MEEVVLGRVVFQRLTWVQIKMLSIFVVSTLSCIVVGFAAGFSYGTGSSAMSLIIPPKSIAPPPIAAVELETITDALDEQPKSAYQEGYNCVDFAWSAMRTLQWRGQPSAIVRLGFPDGTGHAILLVPTADKGYQFIEPQSNQIIRPMVGSIYDGRTISNMTILEIRWIPFDMFLLDPNYGIQGWDDTK